MLIEFRDNNIDQVNIFPNLIVAITIDYSQIFIFRVQPGPFAEEFLQCVTHGNVDPPSMGYKVSLYLNCGNYNLSNRILHGGLAGTVVHGTYSAAELHYPARDSRRHVPAHIPINIVF